MGFFDVVKIVFVPALIALALYAFLAYVAMPLVRAYRQKYSQYSPVDSLSTGTASWRERLTDVVARLVLPRRRVVVDAEAGRRGSAGEESVFADEDGERMFGFDINRSDRRVRGAHVSGHGHGRGEGSVRFETQGAQGSFRDDVEEERRLGVS